ncbi:STAS domain-containing protein [Anaerovorax odorimutans]|uniref:STAS domain-containing protein n=1 Tax=Anaerovorax odorimutans TaxID=109327 RepID=UPI00041718C5|nr:STAS domain-containing protein [Anaerovorax odorimutans]
MSLQIQSNYNQELNKWDLKLEGEIDLFTASKLKAKIEEAYEINQSNIELDLTDLNYIDSTGLGVMIGAYGKMKENNKSIILLNPKDNIKKLLSITNLDKVLCP